MFAVMGFAKLVVLALVFAAVWTVVRWLNHAGYQLRHRRPAPRRAIEAEDLTACRVCGAYLAAGSRRCGRADCPRPQ
jgi:hypothetical protein